MIRTICVITGKSSESFPLECENVTQVLGYLHASRPDLWESFISSNFSVVVSDTTSPDTTTKTLTPEMFTGNLGTLNLIYIGVELKVSALFSTISAAIAAAVAASVGATAAAVIGAVVATVAVVGISYGLGQVIQLLSPSKKLSSDSASDPAVNQTNWVFNGIQNVMEQGGSVPLIFGECLVGGVVIASKVLTLDNTLPTTPISTIPDCSTLPSQWCSL